MTAFVLERLYSTGWRRASELYCGVATPKRLAKSRSPATGSGHSNTPATISPEPILEFEAPTLAKRTRRLRDSSIPA